MLNCDGVFKAQFVKELHAKAHSYIEKKEIKYKKVFEESDLVLIHLRNERFPNLRKSKLLRRGDSPFE
ncbi:hypothetical protein CR513_25225, partial [Mucuna pruriens]